MTMAMAPRIAPTTEPASDPGLRPEEVLSASMALDTFAREALVDTVAGEAPVVFGPEIAAEGDAVSRLVCIAPRVLVEVMNPATVTKSSPALAVVIPLMVPQPQNSVASLSHSNLKAKGCLGSLHDCKLRSWQGREKIVRRI